MAYVIGRPINGICLNGREYVLDDNDKVLKFTTEEEAKKYLKDNGVTEEIIEDEGIEILNEEICSNVD